MTLEADGIIDVWEIETGKVVAQYEGLEVHEDMQSIPDMKQRIAELEATVARLEQDNRRLRHLGAMPVDAMERFHNEANMIDPVYVESGKFDDDHGAIREWLDSLDGDA